MQIIIVHSRKGGTGKTSVAVNVAAALQQDRRTLLIDLDPQGDASTWLGVESTGRALADALLGKVTLGSAVQPGAGGVDVAPGGEAIDHIADTVSRDALRRSLDSLRGHPYDAAIVDCPPGLTSPVLSAYHAGGDVHALVPVDGPSGLQAVRRTAHAWDDAGLDASRLRIVLTRYDRRRVIDRAVDERARDLYGEAVLSSRIRESVVISESCAWRRPLLQHAPRHPAAADLLEVSREVVHG